MESTNKTQNNYHLAAMYTVNHNNIVVIKTPNRSIAKMVYENTLTPKQLIIESSNQLLQVIGKF